MKKVINLAICLTLSLMMLLGIGANIGVTYANEYVPEVDSKASVLIDMDSGKVLYDNNSSQDMPVSSIVKLMTIMLTFEEIDKSSISLLYLINL